MDCLTLITTIANLIIAVGAIGAIIFSALTYRQAKKFQEAEKLSRRGFVGPSDNHGQLIKNHSIFKLLLKFKNYGKNPVSKLYFHVRLFIGAAGFENLTLEKLEKFQYAIEFGNIQPPSAEIEIIQRHKDLISDDSQIHLLDSISQIFVMAHYQDEVLKQTFTDYFVWKVMPNGELYEVSIQEYHKYVTYHKKRFLGLGKIDLPSEL